jgi:5-formyltetrahydrofolate cyclo-ligase
VAVLPAPAVDARNTNDSMTPETSYRDQKSALRKTIRAHRRNLDPAQKVQLDNAILVGLTTLVSEINPASVAGFWPFDGEPDLRPAMDLMQREGIRLALPVVQQTSAGPDMIFRAWNPGVPMVPNRYGILEPGGDEEVRLTEIDLVLLPLVGWDMSGARLGMGAGYYDRALQPFAQEAAPMRVGVAYQLQKVARLPAEPWDIRLHGVLSESGWFECPATD